MIEKKYQTFWKRCTAGFIDGLVFLPLTFFIQPAIYKTHSVYLIVCWDISLGLATLAYSILLHGFYGQTLGKMVSKVKVVDKSEGKLSLRQAFMRDIVPVLSNIVSSVWLIFNAKTYATFVTATKPAVNLMPKWFLIISMSAVIWGLLEVITMLTNNRRRAIHDFIAGSVVCRQD